MSRIVKVSADNYRVKVVSGGDITLDTGANTGNVYVTGNLTVQGTYTTVDSTTTVIKDNVIRLNNGQTGPGIGALAEFPYQSGLIIARGEYADAMLVFDETVTHYDAVPTHSVTSQFYSGSTGSTTLVVDTVVGDIITGLAVTGTGFDGTQYVRSLSYNAGTGKTTIVLTTPPSGVPSGTIYFGPSAAGTFVFKTTDGDLSGIQVASISNDGASNIVFDLRESDKVLSIVNVDATDYANRLAAGLPSIPDTPEDNYIVTKKFVGSYINSGVVTPGMADVDKIYKSLSSVIRSKIQAYDDNVQVFIYQSGSLTTELRIDDAGLKVDNINSLTTANLKLQATTNNVEISAFLNLNDQTPTNISNFGAVVSGTTKLYSQASLTALSETPGRTGVFFANSIGRDELVAKNRALLFSMLF